jgi:hypothetical protein
VAVPVCGLPQSISGGTGTEGIQTKVSAIAGAGGLQAHQRREFLGEFPGELYAASDI